MVPVDQVLNLGVKMMALIRKLHDQGGVAHGDKHAGNICFANDWNEHQLRLINFGRAYLVVSAADAVEPMNREPFSWNDPLLSPWNMKGFTEARRDDVFKVLIVMALLINGNEYVPTLNKQAIETAFEYKTKGDIFTIPARAAVVQNRRVTELLAEILAIVRSTELDQRPNYEAIPSRLNEAVAA
jgi:hypothetical protein